MTKKVIRYGSQCVGTDELAALKEVLESDFLTQGSVITRFEAAIAETVGAKHAIAVSSGTAGLHIACLAAGLEPGKTALTTAMTFAATVNSIKYTGASAELLDIDSDDLFLSLDGLAAKTKANPSISAVLPVHFAGLAGDMAALKHYSGKAAVIEDACHALGGTYVDGRPIGSGAYSDMAVFSFHPVKLITTAEGGAVVTNDDGLAKRLSQLRNHGIERNPADWVNQTAVTAPWWQEQQELGFNYRMSELHAALGLAQLKKMDQFIKRRREIAAHFDQSFQSLDFVNPLQSAADQRRRSALHLYLVQIDWAAIKMTRTEFMNALAARGVGSQVHYIPVYMHPIHQHLRGTGNFPQVTQYYESCLSLPLHPGMTDEDVELVVTVVKDLVSN